MLADKVRKLAASLDPRPFLARVGWRNVVDTTRRAVAVVWRQVRKAAVIVWHGVAVAWREVRAAWQQVASRVKPREIAAALDPRKLKPYLSLTDDNEDRATVVVGACIASVVLGAIYWVSRIGFVNPAEPVLNAVGMALFVVATPLWLMRFTQGRSVVVAHWWWSQPALMLLCIAITAMLGMVSYASGVVLAPVVSLPGALLALVTIVVWLRRARFVSTTLFVLGTMLFTIWSAGVVWGSRYKMPLYWEAFALRGNVHHDPLYFASIANMLETYGVASTGMDGIPVIRYHFGSAWLFSKWAHLIGTDVLSFYSLGYPIIVIPAFFAAILLLAIEIRGTLPPESERRLRADYRIWLVLLAATIGLIPTDALVGLGIWNENLLISESYLAGLAVFLLVMASGIAFWRSNAYRSIGMADTTAASGAALSRLSEALAFLLAFLPLSLVVLGFLKVSLMLLLLATIVFLTLRLRLWRHWAGAAATALCVGFTAITYPVVSVPEQNSGVALFSFMRVHVTEGWQQFFPLINLMWSWIYVGARFWEDRIRTTRELSAAVRGGRMLDVELVLLIAILGFLPGEIVTIHGGSAVYFSDVQRWVALAFIISRLGIWARKWRAMREARGQKSPGGGWRGVRLSTVLAVFIGAPFLLTLALNSMQWPVRVARANVALRTEIASKGGGGLITDPGPLSRGVTRADYYPIVTALREIAQLPIEERRQSALFIPQSYRNYWGMFDSDERCTYVSFIAPALSGIAMVDGMPAFGCRVSEQYNMGSYPPRVRPQTEADVSEARLCARARSDGFSQVLVLAPDTRGIPRRRRIACGT